MENVDLVLNRLAIISLMQFYRRPIWIVAPKELFIHPFIHPQETWSEVFEERFQTLCAPLTEKKTPNIWSAHTQGVHIHDVNHIFQQSTQMWATMNTAVSF